ncbi:SH3 domain-containing protein [Aquibium microcysteis]|uniref:SH3 domain-containing protein n=1 Tax=Aquibium microcysteis TaxID=675281 RepID=UPI00165D1515|nr:SH3 domain-containing protein [Aquibium microcysteis]
MKLLPFACLSAAFLFAVDLPSARAGVLGAFSGGTLDVRAGPGGRFPTVGVLGAGATITIHGCLRRSSWCDVSASGLRGWVPGRQIRIALDQYPFSLPASECEGDFPVVLFREDDPWDVPHGDDAFHGDPDDDPDDGFDDDADHEHEDDVDRREEEGPPPQRPDDRDIPRGGWGH